MAANHSSYLDPPIVGIACPDEVHFLARETLFKNRLFAWYIRKLNTHPVSRGRENVATIKKCCELLKEGKKVMIFPEGTRSVDGQLQKGQLGVAMLVLRTGTVVVPIYIHGTFSVWNCHQKKPKLFGKIASVFGAPLDFSTLDRSHKKEAEEKIAQEVMKAIERLQDWYLAGAVGDPN